MKETERITKLFEEIYDGDSWVGVSLVDTLKNISGEKAAKKIRSNWNSIWEIVVHIISWRDNVLQRVNGAITHEPDDNYIRPVEDPSEKEWQKVSLALKNSQEEWISFLTQMNDEDLEKIYQGNNSSYYKNIHGIVQHDTYHLGQIVILAKEA